MDRLDSENDRIALVDMDGTIADYDKSMTEELAKIASPTEPPPSPYGKEPYLKARRELIKSRHGFWRNLPRLELGFEIVEELEKIGFQLYVLSKGPKRTTHAWTEKAEWCLEHIPQAEVILTRKLKSLVYGRVLVDDWPEYFNPWLRVRPRGLVVAVAHPWNANIVHPSVFRYDGKNRDELRKMLRRAWDRQSGETL